MYRLKYRLDFETGEFSSEEIEEAKRIDEDIGAADKLLVVSLLFPHERDSGFSAAFLGADGISGKVGPDAITDEDLFRVWSMMADRLASSQSLDGSRRGLADMVHQQIRQAVMMARS